MSDIKDSRDNRVYRVSQSGSLNWFTGNLSHQEGASLVVKGKSFYAPKAWAKACPDSSRIPNEAEWSDYIKDNFIGARKKQNMNTFAGAPLGYYEMPGEKDENQENKLIAPDAAYFAIAGDGTQAMMLDLKRGLWKIVNIGATSAVPVRCISDRDLLEERNISKKDMMMTDPRDGQKYKVELRDSSKAWMTQNLKYNLTSAKQCFLEDSVFCIRHGRFYTHTEALRACPSGWHLPDDAEWRDYQKDQAKLDWDNLGRGGCRDWDEYCDETFTGHYWSKTSVKKKTGRSWEFRRQARSINRTDESVQKGLYVRCVADLN